jgi:thioesterase domain-containing protein
MSEIDPMKCPCLYWARTAETLHDSGHHPICDGTGQHKSFTARPDEPADKEKGDGYTLADERARCLRLVTRARETRDVTLKAMVHLSKEIESLQSQLAAERTRREDWEAAVFAKAYRKGFWYGSTGGEELGGVTAFQSEVDAAYAEWVERGKKTHLDDAGPEVDDPG